jgi:hypothetical protein
MDTQALPLDTLPLDTWMVVEARSDEVVLVATHAEQKDAEADCARRNRGLPRPRYCALMALEPIAERMGRAASSVRHN